MGLDFSHCDAHWAYSGFHRFRKRLASLIGLDLEQMEGFRGEKFWEGVTDPICYLLNHSDCDGDLLPEQCVVIAPRLKELVKDWLDDDYDKVNAIELAKGMERAAHEGVSLEFR